MLTGIFLSSLGVSLSVKSKLGATPVGVCPAVLSPYFKISIGMGTKILLGLCFLIQIIILKSDFKFLNFIQLVTTFIYGSFVDLTSNIISTFPNELLWQKLIYCGLGIFALALGVFIMLKTGFPMLPQDAVVDVISKKYKKEYGKVKIAFDIVLTTIALVASLVLYQQVVHIGIATVAAAIFVGRIISGLDRIEGITFFFNKAIGEI